MRYHLSNLSRPKRVSKALRHELALLGFHTSLSSCQDLTARMLGYSHWHQMQAEAGRHEPSPPDHALFVLDRSDEYEFRLEQYTAVLADAFPLGTKRSTSMVRGIDPSGPIVDPSQRAEPPCKALPFAIPGASGATIGFYGIAAMHDGRIVDFRAPRHAPDHNEIAKCILEAVETDGCFSHFHLRYMLNMKGTMHNEQSSPDEEVFRRSVLPNVHREAFEAFDAVQGMSGSSDQFFLYDLLRVDGEVGERRRRFAAAFPWVASMLMRPGTKSLAIIDGQSPAKALSPALRSVLGLNHMRVDRLCRRLLDWPDQLSALSMMELHAIAALDADRLPRETYEARNFRSVVGSIDLALPRSMPERYVLGPRLVASAGSRSWIATNQWIVDTARKLFKKTVGDDFVSLGSHIMMSNVVLAIENYVRQVLAPECGRDVPDDLVGATAIRLVPDALDDLVALAEAWTDGSILAHLANADDDPIARCDAWGEFPFVRREIFEAREVPRTSASNWPHSMPSVAIH